MDIDGQASQQPFQTLAGATMGMINSDRDLLHNYIYDYLIKQNYLDSAKIFYKEGEVTSSKKTTRLIRNSSIKQSSSPSSNSGEPNSSHPQPSNSTGPDLSTNNDASVVNGVSTTSSTSSTPRPFSSQDPSRSNPSINGNSANRPVCYFCLFLLFHFIFFYYVHVFFLLLFFLFFIVCFVLPLFLTRLIRAPKRTIRMVRQPFLIVNHQPLTIL